MNTSLTRNKQNKLAIHEKDFDDISLGGIGIDASFGTEGEQELGWLSYHSSTFHISKSMEQYVLGTAYRDLSQGNYSFGFQQVRIRGKIQEL
jgi:hypothetical protein